jgi:hypothetical protein
LNMSAPPTIAVFGYLFSLANSPDTCLGTGAVCSSSVSEPFGVEHLQSMLSSERPTQATIVIVFGKVGPLPFLMLGNVVDHVSALATGAELD